MTDDASDRRRRAEVIFQEAVDRPPAERASYLDGVCGDDGELRAAVDRLLQAHTDAGASFMEAAAVTGPAVAILEGAGGGPVAPPPGAHIGSYELLDVLGEGGMGVVYRARQERPSRIVALKIIRPGIATPEMLRRFEHEAQMLGRLHHPGIAQVYEAGTFEGGVGPQPFFAMELVEGERLLDHAAGLHLDARRRLELMARICQAVQHAHQKGVIHRDLKPDNILVDASGQPRILDFGVARATNADVQTTTLRTEIGQLIGTLQYMSPEQAKGDPHDLDTRSDVYALGVIAYELLAGRPPLDLRQKMIHEAIRVIREEEPPSLGRIRRPLGGDVERIVSKAMSKDRERRYPSAAELAADIGRYMNDEPVTARKPGFGYELRKFLKRNRRAVAATSIVAMLVVACVVLGVGLLASWIVLSPAFVEEQTVARFGSGEVINLIESAEAGQPEMTVRALLDEASERLDGQPGATRAHGRAEIRIRHALGSGYANLEEFAAAESQFRQAGELSERIHGPDARETVLAEVSLCGVAAKARDWERAENLLELTLPRARVALGKDHEAVGRMVDLLETVRDRRAVEEQPDGAG